MNAVVAPDRKVYAGSATADEGLTSNDKFTLDLIDKAKEAAESPTTAGFMKIRPVNIEGVGKVYCLYLHPYQVTDLRTNTSTGQWLDIQKAAMSGGKVSGNPIFNGSLGMYNNCVLRSAEHVTQGVNSSTAAAITTVRRAVLLGAQSAVIGFGMKNSPGRLRWNEELFDHKRRLEVSAWSIWGLRKTVFNSNDFGTVVISTYAAAHHS